MVPGPSCEVPSETSGITIEWDRGNEAGDPQATLVPLAVCFTHKILWDYRRFRLYSNPQEGRSRLIYPKVFLGFGFGSDCVVKVFCVPKDSTLLWEQYLGILFL
jgi:hypothetical protein